MARKILISASLAALGAAFLSSTAASAQSYFGFSIGSGYPAPGYYAPNYGYYDYDNWAAHRRWEEDEARRRYWQHEYWERAHWYHHDDDDDDDD